MDGVLDWYLLGVATGLGVSAGVAAAWLASRAAPVRPLAAIVLVLAVALVVVIGMLAVVWALAAAAVALVLAGASVRRLARQALPAAAIGAAALAVVPLVGFAEALLAPALGARLGRRADSRYAGLRVLAKD